MKVKSSIIIIALGFCLDFIAVLFKIQHWPGSSELLTIATICKVFGVIVFVVKLLSYPKAKDFLNW
jgi:hypothetical protein